VLDGECGLCNRTALFLKARLVRPGTLRFVGQQSEEGQALLESLPADLAGLDTVVLFRAGRAYVRSAAALRTGFYLRWWWRALVLLGLLVPLPLRDAVYDAIARKRHQWWEPPDHCAF